MLNGSEHLSGRVLEGSRGSGLGIPRPFFRWNFTVTNRLEYSGEVFFMGQVPFDYLGEQQRGT